MLELIGKKMRSSFPIDDPPERLLLNCDMSLSDIEKDIKGQFINKLWGNIGLDVWISVGHPRALMQYFLPSAFHYYVPSLIMSTLSNGDYLSWGLEGVLPQNQKRMPKGNWWFEYFSYFSDDQKAAVRLFVMYAKKIAPLYSEEDFLASCADQIWLS